MAGKSVGYLVRGSLIKNGSVSWLASDAQYTQKTVSINKPLEVAYKYLFVVYNPSSETDVEAKFVSKKTFGGSERNILRKRLTFAKAQTITGTALVGEEKEVESIFINSNCDIVFSNDVGGASLTTGFTLYYELYEVI